MWYYSRDVWYNFKCDTIQVHCDIIQWYMWYNSRIKVELYHIVLKIDIIQVSVWYNSCIMWYYSRVIQSCFIQLILNETQLE